MADATGQAAHGQAGLAAALQRCARAVIPKPLQTLAAPSLLLFAGLATGQACAFARNAILGHALAPTDFGIAAALTLTLQMLEMLSDPGADKLILQARDGAQANVIGTVHALLAARSLASAALLLALAWPLAWFYQIPETVWAFAALAIAPLLKSGLHLDMRRQQRALKTSAFLRVEVGPQIVALAITPIAVTMRPTYEAVVLIVLSQAAATLLISHAVARRPFGVRWDREVAAQALRFCWPIWLSALPLIAVYQGDRILIGRFLGMEALAQYSAAFLITMVPGLLFARVASAVMLPMLAQQRGAVAFRQASRLGAIAAIAVALVYWLAFAIVGGRLLGLAFGPAYAGLDTLVTTLALMFAVRMVQVAPGMVLMALGDTRALLIAGCVRALALAPAAALLVAGADLTTVAAVGVFGELASLSAVVARLRWPSPHAEHTDHQAR